MQNGAREGGSLAFFFSTTLITDAKLQTPLGQTPVNQSVLDLITHATNPLRLAAMEVASLPWL